jgi:hypothetical protein
MFKIFNQYGLCLCSSSVKTECLGVFEVLGGRRSDAPFFACYGSVSRDVHYFRYAVFWDTKAYWFKILNIKY